jgi:hypothetical protein
VAGMNGRRNSKTSGKKLPQGLKGRVSLRKLQPLLCGNCSLGSAQSGTLGDYTEMQVSFEGTQKCPDCPGLLKEGDWPLRVN